MLILNRYFLNQSDREKMEKELFLLNPDIDHEETFSLDDYELMDFYEQQKILSNPA
jgi:hypothetical protein